MAFGLAVVAVSLAGCTTTREPIRELTLVARGMTFTVESAPEASNPLIALRVGERVHLTLKNEAPGLLHDVAIPALKVEVEQMRAGESRDTTFTVPNLVGRHEYRCRPHAELMNGVVEVTP